MRTVYPKENVTTWHDARFIERVTYISTMPTSWILYISLMISWYSVNYLNLAGTIAVTETASCWHVVGFINRLLMSCQPFLQENFSLAPE